MLEYCPLPLLQGIAELDLIDTPVPVRVGIIRSREEQAGLPVRIATLSESPYGAVQLVRKRQRDAVLIKQQRRLEGIFVVVSQRESRCIPAVAARRKERPGKSVSTQIRHGKSSIHGCIDTGTAVSIRLSGPTPMPRCTRSKCRAASACTLYSSSSLCLAKLVTSV